MNGKRARDNASSDEEMASGESSPALSSSAPTDEPVQPMKRLQLDNSSNVSPSAGQDIRCMLPPHAEMKFSNYNTYESHYEQHHLHRCTECHKNFPSDHYMQLHIGENHDPITSVRRDRGERTFACFVEDCDRVCSTAQKRRMHLIDKHGFPKLYDFFIVNGGIDRRTSMLRRSATSKQTTRRRKTLETSPPEQEEHKPAAEISKLTASMSALKFVPRNLQFGRGGSKAFTR